MFRSIFTISAFGLANGCLDGVGNHQSNIDGLACGIFSLIGRQLSSHTVLRAGGGKGGGGSKEKPTAESRGKKTDIVDRYKEINDQLEKTTRLLEKNNVEADSLWGAKRIAALKNGVKLLEQENK